MLNKKKLFSAAVLLGTLATTLPMGGAGANELLKEWEQLAQEVEAAPSAFDPIPDDIILGYTSVDRATVTRRTLIRIGGGDDIRIEDNQYSYRSKFRHGPFVMVFNAPPQRPLLTSAYSLNTERLKDGVELTIFTNRFGKPKKNSYYFTSDKPLIDKAKLPLNLPEQDITNRDRADAFNFYNSFISLPVYTDSTPTVGADVFTRLSTVRSFLHFGEEADDHRQRNRPIFISRSEAAGITDCGSQRCLAVNISVRFNGEEFSEWDHNNEKHVFKPGSAKGQLLLDLKTGFPVSGLIRRDLHPQSPDGGFTTISYLTRFSTEY